MNREESLRRTERWDFGAYFQLPYSFLQFLRPAEAILLAHIINIWRMRLRAEQDKIRLNRRWVRFPDKDIQKTICYTPRTAQKCFEKLHKMGIVHKKVMGIPARRWLSLDVEKLEGFAENAQTSSTQKRTTGSALLCTTGGTQKRTSSTPQKCSAIDDEKNIEKEEHPRTICPPTERGTESEDWRSLGLQLRDAISRVTTVPCTAKPSHWGASIRALHVTDKVPTEQIKSVLNWYCGMLLVEGDINSNGNPNYLPIAYSGDAFRKKFMKLAGARAKHRRGRNGRQGSQGGGQFRDRDGGREVWDGSTPPPRRLRPKRVDGPPLKMTKAMEDAFFIGNCEWMHAK